MAPEPEEMKLCVLSLMERAVVNWWTNLSVESPYGEDLAKRRETMRRADAKSDWEMSSAQVISNWRI